MENREKMASATIKEQKYGGYPANISQTTKDPYVSGSKTKIGKITIIWGEMPMGPMLAVLIHILGKH